MLVYLAFCVLQIIFFFLIFVISFIIFCRLWFEPYIGMCKCKTDLNGKVALVTGGTSGIGFETAKDLARRGAKVIIASRDVKTAQKAVEDIVRETGNTNVEYIYLNLFKPSNIRDFAAKFNRTVDRLDILVNNAGCAGLLFRRAENGVDIVMQVNHIGPFLLTNLLMDKLVASKPSRIIIVTSKLYSTAKLNIEELAGVKSQSKFIRYANSKLCNVLWGRALAKRLPKGVTVNSLHPGLVQTNIFKRFGPTTVKLIDFITGAVFKNAKEGAQTSIHLCVAPELEDCSGGYYSDCKLRTYYKIAQDDELVEKVWEESVRLSEK